MKLVIEGSDIVGTGDHKITLINSKKSIAMARKL